MKRITTALALLFLCPALFAADFTATFLHVNDTHDRIDPTIIAGKPYGGMPRLITLVERYRKSDPNPIVLHGGDAFQGTFYFNVYEGLADLAFLNALRLDAMELGNHEFDRGPAALAAFVRGAQFPVLAANLNVENEPLLRGKIARSTVITRGGERIGIVGGITPTLATTSNPGPTIGLYDLASSLQTEIDALTAAGINKIVLLTHVGYGPEQELARTLRNVDVIVGGHSHTLLGTTTAPGWPASQGPYPTVVENPEHGKTLVVQSWEGERVMGRLQVTFDEQGRVTRWGTTQPVAVDESVPEDPAAKALAEAFQKPIAAQRDRKIAVASEAIRSQGMGSIIADAMLAGTAKYGTVLALMNSGGVRAAFEPGDITFGSAISVQPFGDTLVVMDVTGAQLRQALEDIVEGSRTRALYVSSGSSYALDATKAAGSRVTDLMVAGSPVEPAKTYRICVNNFLARGGDEVVTLQNATGYRYDTGLLDVDLFVEYLTAHSLIKSGENRVRGITANTR
ncbi:MAG: bifunctional metallophosphatase/5'-nucleotidase [Acidobacteriota bacterium]